eukprot:555912-Hanusia_phi.AAC.3
MQVDAPFELQAIRNDYVHALLLFFEVGFTQVRCSGLGGESTARQGHKPLWLSTSPHHKSTHWHQTVTGNLRLCLLRCRQVLYLHDVLTIAKDELIQGHIKIFPSTSTSRAVESGVS